MTLVPAMFRYVIHYRDADGNMHYAGGMTSPAVAARSHAEARIKALSLVPAFVQRRATSVETFADLRGEP